MESNKNFPEKLITYIDILRGIGEVALESIKRFLNQAQETELHKPDHYIKPYTIDEDQANRWDESGRYL